MDGILHLLKQSGGGRPKTPGLRRVVRLSPGRRTPTRSILAALTTLEEASVVEDIARIAVMSETTVRKYLRLLVANGEVVVERVEGRRFWFRLPRVEDELRDEDPLAVDWDEVMEPPTTMVEGEKEDL